jgi:hypothetical protein
MVVALRAYRPPSRGPRQRARGVTVVGRTSIHPFRASPRRPSKRTSRQPSNTGRPYPPRPRPASASARFFARGGPGAQFCRTLIVADLCSKARLRIRPPHRAPPKAGRVPAHRQGSPLGRRSAAPAVRVQAADGPWAILRVRSRSTGRERVRPGDRRWRRLGRESGNRSWRSRRRPARAAPARCEWHAVLDEVRRAVVPQRLADRASGDARRARPRARRSAGRSRAGGSVDVGRRLAACGRVCRGRRSGGRRGCRRCPPRAPDFASTRSRSRSRVGSGTP